MGLIGWLKDSKEEIALALKARRAFNAVRKEIGMNHSWGKTLAAVAKDFAITSVAALVAFFAVPDNLVAALGSLSPETRGALIPFVSALLVMARKYIKHTPKRTGAAVIVLALLPSFATAQEPTASPTSSPRSEFDLFGYLSSHAYFAGGPLLLNGENHTVYEVRFVDDFRVADKTRGAARVSLFSLTRAGEQAPAPRIPSTIQEAKAYSDGEVWLSAYREIKPWLAFECLTGVTFKMTSFSGSVGDPLDGTKFAAGCGPRFRYQDNHVSVIGGHYGPVAEKGKVLGFVPNILVHAHIPLTFLGKNTSFTPDVAFGATPAAVADPDKRRDITKSLRLLVSTRF